jgi:hypothetical protein
MARWLAEHKPPPGGFFFSRIGNLDMTYDKTDIVV